MAYTTYTDTDEQVETRSSAYGSRSSVLDNQLDFSSTSVSSYQPSYSTLYTNEEEEQTTSFEAEKEYKMEDDLGGDITIVPTFMPTIERKSVSKSEANDVKIRLNARGKIILSVFSVIAVLLVSFCIYNAVRISSLTASLANKQAQVQMMNREVYVATSEYNELVSPSNILASLPNGYVDSKNNFMEVDINARPIIASAESSTNWFDKVCEFLSNLFN